jgi:hypothetical protein
MPGFNQTGPAGQGSMTGRRMGKCTNFGANQKKQNDERNEINHEANREINQDVIQGRGMGRRRNGRGLGLGQQNRFRGNR